MNRVELATRVSERSGLTIKESGAAISAMLETIAAALAAGQEVSLHGFGTFSARERAPRTIVHPTTKERLLVSGTRAARFAAANALKQRLASGAPPTEVAST